MRVGLFLSSYTWTRPLNAFGVRQHVLELYERVFSGHDVRIYPKRETKGLVWDVLSVLKARLQCDLIVACQGFPILAAGLLAIMGFSPRAIVHLWSMPGVTESRLSARLMDFFLRRLLRKAEGIVVVGSFQHRYVESLGYRRVWFVPVSVDSAFWSPQEPDHSLLAETRVNRREFVITIGGPDRDEVFGAQTAALLGIEYVRVTYDRHTFYAAQKSIEEAGLGARSTVLLNPSDQALRSLISSSFLVCLSTKTRTNPAGLTSLVVSMACGALVAAPPEIADRYIEDGVTGYFLGSNPADLVRAIAATKSQDLDRIRERARNVAATRFTHDSAAALLVEQLQGSGLLTLHNSGAKYA